MSIGSNIKKYRETKGWTQRELADECNLAEITIRQYEANKREPKPAILTNIAKKLNVPVAVLMGYSYQGKITMPNGEQKDFYGKEAPENSLGQLRSFSKELISSFGETKSDKINELFDSLNEKGKDKAIEQTEILTKIPEYQKSPDQ